MKKVKRIVKDVTYQQDERLKYFAGPIYGSIEKFVSEYNAQQKVKDKPIPFEEETKKFVYTVKMAVEEFAEHFSVIKEVDVFKEDLIDEFNKLNQDIQEMEQDPKIRYLDAKKKLFTIRERQIKIENYLNQISKQEKENK